MFEVNQKEPEGCGKGEDKEASTGHQPQAAFNHVITDFYKDSCKYNPYTPLILRESLQLPHIDKDSTKKVSKEGVESEPFVKQTQPVPLL